MRSIQSETGKLESVILRSVQNSFLNQEKIDQEWQKLHYLDRPDYQRAVGEYEFFRQLFITHQIDIIEAPAAELLTMDSIYVRDSTFVCDDGAVLCRMGKTDRIPESESMRSVYKSQGITVLGEIKAPGKLEGGDILWLDNHTLAVGQGYRTNAAGIEQLRDFTRDCVDEIIVVPSPHWNGPTDVFHLMSVVSPLDTN
ncbi:MAG: hypothetical protein KDD94_09385, partial [Calditrichaeota bacterium]|nr:hypothetical protein [Calditrichota bacterium]